MKTLATRNHAHGGKVTLATLALLGTTALGWSGITLADELVIRDLGAPPAGNPNAEGDFNRPDDALLAADGAAMGGIDPNGTVRKDAGAPPTGNPYAEDYNGAGSEAVTTRLRGEDMMIANEVRPPLGNPNAEVYDAGVGNHDGEEFAGAEGIVEPGGVTPAMGDDLRGAQIATGRIDALLLRGEQNGGAITLDNGETYVLNANEPMQLDLNEGATVTFAYNVEGDHKTVVGTPQILD
jgi:hypothetical protein